ncbi:MAG TPA: class I SAM-dependent methyltransferase [Acidimicrobiales bacterium]|nr:class I SAM-dependent methyltransferase [Acidimicrobiales bacterium]
MLTVDFDRLGLQAGDRVLDLGCGAGRHAFECVRRGASVVALDANFVELKGVTALLTAMVEAGEAPAESASLAVQGDAFGLPFPDASFDRVIAAEVLEHLPDDRTAMSELARVLKPGGRMAVTVPRYGPEVVNWMLSDEYHNVPGGHIRIYRRSQLIGRLQHAGLRVLGTHHAHALHSPYWWLKCLVGTSNDSHPAVRAYHRLLVWDIVKRPAVTRLPEWWLNPVMGKSFVVYSELAP